LLCRKVNNYKIITVNIDKSSWEAQGQVPQFAVSELFAFITVGAVYQQDEETKKPPEGG
jgi:hypothetical protein